VLMTPHLIRHAAGTRTRGVTEWTSNRQIIVPCRFEPYNPTLTMWQTVSAQSLFKAAWRKLSSVDVENEWQELFISSKSHAFHDISRCGPSKLWLILPLDLVSYCLYAPKIIVVCLLHDQLCNTVLRRNQQELENGPVVPSCFNVSVRWSLEGVVFSGAVLFLAKTT